MAIFASTTLGTSDPSRAMSIKALEARAQALAAAQAKQEAPTSVPSPWQGAGNVMNTVADAFATKRADQAAAQRRKDLAGYISAAGDNPTMQQVGPIMAADSDVGKAYMSEIAARRSQAAQIQAQKEAAAEAARTAETAAVAQEGRVQARPHSPLGQVTADVGRKPTEEEAKAEIEKMTQRSPADQAAMGTARDENINLQTTAANLAEADDLLTKGIYHGAGAGYRTDYGQVVPNALQGVAGTDDATTERSKRYAQIMSSEVVARLKALKGPASNKDMDWAAKTVNDPASTLKNKQDAMKILRAQMDAHLKSSEQTLKGMGTTGVKVDVPAAGGGGGPAADPMEGRTITSADGKTKMVRRGGKMGADVMADDIPAGFTLDAPVAAAAADIPAGFKLDETSKEREQALRAKYGKEIMGSGEPGYGTRFIDAATMGVSRPLSGAVRAVGGIFDPDTTAGERYRAGVGAAGDYFKKGEENTPGALGVATDVVGSLAAPPVGKIATLGRAGLTGGRELLGRIIAQGATTGAVEGAARNAEDVGSAVKGGIIGGGIGAGTSAAVGTVAKAIPGVGSAQKAVRKADQGTTPEELKAAAKPLFEKLDQGGIAYAQPQTKALKDGIDDLVATNQYNPIAHQKISGFVDELGQKASQPQGMGFNDLHNLRSALAKEARGQDASTREAAGKVIGKIDDLVLGNTPAGNPNNVDVKGAYTEARKLWKAASIADDVGYTAGKAERKASSKLGVNPDEANRGAFRPVLEKAEKPGAYSPYDDKQRELLAKIVQGDKLQNTYRNLGAVAGSPITKGLVGAGAATLGFTHGGIGGGLGGFGVGTAADTAVKGVLERAAANRGAKNIDELIRNITGSSPKDIPPEAMRALLAKQFAQRGGAAYATSKLGEQ